MSEQHTNLLPMTRTETCTALNMSRTTFWRETKSLNIPKGKKIVPKDLIRICEHLRRDIRHLENYTLKYGINQNLKHNETF